MGAYLGAPLTPQQATALGALPVAAAAMPPATALDGAVGTATEYARADHTHAARIQRTVLPTGTDGTVTWVFARPIVCTTGKAPPVTYMVEDAGSPVVVTIMSRAFTADAVAGTDTHTAVTIKAQRSQSILGLGGLTLITSLVTALQAYSPFNAAAAGVKVNLFAAPPTQ